MIYRSFFLLTGISIILGFLVFITIWFFSPLEPYYGEGCAILVFDEAEDDRLLQETLSQGGLEGFISESTQKVFLDDFGTMRTIALDSFFNEIEPFDPRDDGFAVKLRSFFVRDGKRFFYLHFDDTSSLRAGALEKQLSNILNNTPFTLYFFGQKKTFFWDFIILASACLVALFLSRSKRSFLYVLPVLLAFGWGGFLLLAGILSAIWELTREPLLEISAARRYNRLSTDYAGGGVKGIYERLKPFKTNLFLVCLFSFLYFLLTIIGNLPVFPALVGFFSFISIIYLHFRFDLDSAGKNQHKPFVPVILFPARINTFSLFPFLLPFALMSLILLFFPQMFSQFMENTIPIENEYIISSSDHDRHIEFGRFFSYRTLDHSQDEPFSRYYLGDDGLIAGSYTYDGFSWTGDQPVPVFPLESLMTFLLNYYEPAFDIPNRGIFNISLKQWVFVIIIVLVCLLDLIRNGKKTKKNATIWGDKCIAA